MKRKKFASTFKAKVAIEAVKGHHMVNQIAAEYEALYCTREHLFRFQSQASATALRARGFVDISVEPLMLLSLSSSRYAGGEVMGHWPPLAFLNRSISFLGVAVARVSGFHNKILRK